MTQRTTERPAPAGASRPAPRPPGARRSYLTVRGVLVALFALCLAACLIAAWKQWDLLAGLVYCTGALAAPVYVRPQAQLQVVTAPPAVFLLAVAIAQALTGQGSSAHGWLASVIEGTFLMLAATAPWLFAGTVGCVALAMFRGLPACVREFRSGFGRKRRSASWHRA